MLSLLTGIPGRDANDYRLRAGSFFFSPIVFFQKKTLKDADDFLLRAGAFFFFARRYYEAFKARGRLFFLVFCYRCYEVSSVLRPLSSDFKGAPARRRYSSAFLNT